MENRVLNINSNEEVRISSREVAEMMNARHDSLMRKIESLGCKIREHKNVVSEYWVESIYVVEGNNKTYKEYLISKKGCEFIAHKSTGSKGVAFTIAYMNRFSQMEKQLQEPKAITCIEDALIVQLQEQKQIKEQQQVIDIRLTKVENTMTIDYGQQEDLRSLGTIRVIYHLGGMDTPAYKELGKKVFCALWRDYKRVMRVNSYRNTAIKDFEKGKEFIENWNPSRSLELMITGANAQIRF